MSCQTITKLAKDWMYDLYAIYVVSRYLIVVFFVKPHSRSLIYSRGANSAYMQNLHPGVNLSM